jgi:hypothetical protein
MPVLNKNLSRLTQPFVIHDSTQVTFLHPNRVIIYKIEIIHKNRWLFIQCELECYIVRINDRIITVWMQWSLRGNSKKTSHCINHKQVFCKGHNWHLLNTTFSFRTSISNKSGSVSCKLHMCGALSQSLKLLCRRMFLVFKNMHFHSFRNSVTRNVSNNHCVLQ